DADRVREFFLRRNDRKQRALGERAMTDLATTRAAERTRLADRVRREVVVMHVTLGVYRLERVDDLLIAAWPQRRDRKHLGLSALEQRAAVCARQDPDLAGDGADLVELATIRTDPLLDDRRTHRLLQRLLEDLGDLGRRDVRALRREHADRGEAHLIGRPFASGLVGVTDG